MSIFPVQTRRPPIFVVIRKICFKHMIKTKIFTPLKCISPQTLKLGYGPDSADNVSALRTFVLKTIRPRDVTQGRKRFFL